MKLKMIPLLGVLGLACWSNSASAWWQWHYSDVPYVPVPVTTPAMWFNFAPFANMGMLFANPALWFTNPVATAPNPGMWYYQTLPLGATQFWNMPMMSSGVFVEQLRLPTGYGFKIGSRDPGQSITVNVEGGSLVISSHSATSSGMGGGSGFSNQWVSLPADANVAMMTMSRRGGVIEVFIPRR